MSLCDSSMVPCCILYMFYTLTDNPCFPLPFSSSFPFSPSFLLLLFFWCNVSSRLVWRCGLVCVREISVVRFTGTVASHFQRLHLLYLFARYIWNSPGKARVVCVWGKIHEYAIVGILLTKRQITLSIIRISGSMTSHSVALDTLYRLHKKNPEKSSEKDRVYAICAQLAAPQSSVKRLYSNI